MKIKSEAELAEFVTRATGPLQVSGGGTRGVNAVGESLTVAGMSGITLYEPGAMTVVAQAGTPVADIEAALGKENQRLAFEPMDHRGLLGTKGEPTIGGVFAGNFSGPRRISVGAARDFLLGVRYVDGRGTIVKNGGRVMKNVTGYDLVKLMAGSYGTLGVLSEVSLKVLPNPETQSTLVLSGLSDVQAVKVMSRAMGSPFEVSGAAHDPAKAETYLRFEGFDASVRYRLGQVRDLLSGDAGVLEAAASAGIWDSLRDVATFHGQQGDVWRVSCKPSDGPDLAAKADALAHVFDWSGGLIWLRMPEGSDLRSKLGVYNGHATLVKAAQGTRLLSMFEPETAGVARLSAGLRAKFDPKGLFNRGLMSPAA
jgi:glycolate oxidase FAD binding subunit